MGPATPTSRTGGRTAGRTLAATRLVLALVVCIGVFNAGVSQADAGKHHKLHHSSVGGKPAPPHKHKHHADAQDVLKPEASTDQAVAGHKHAKKHTKGGPAHAVSPPSAGADAGGADGHGRSEHAHHAKQHHQTAKNGDGHARHGKKRHHVDDRPSQLEEFGTTGGDGEEPKKAKPAPTAPPAPAPVDPAAERMPGPHPASVPTSVQRGSRWSEDVKVYGACLEEFAKLVQPTNCAKHELGDADYFLQMLDQEQHTVTAGYKTGLARAGLVIEGLGLNATSGEATALLRHAVQRSRVQLAHACAGPESRCSKEMVPVNKLDSAVGKDKNCPLQVLRMADVAPSLAEPRQLEAMRGRAAEIARAFKDTNAPSFFWADSPEYAAAVSVCYNVRLYGLNGEAPAPAGMLLKENIYATPGMGITLPSLEEEEEGANDFRLNLIFGKVGFMDVLNNPKFKIANTPLVVEENSIKDVLKTLGGKSGDPGLISATAKAADELTTEHLGENEKKYGFTPDTTIKEIYNKVSNHGTHYLPEGDSVETGNINLHIDSPTMAALNGSRRAEKMSAAGREGRKLRVFGWNSHYACSMDAVCKENAVREWTSRIGLKHQKLSVGGAWEAEQHERIDLGVAIKLADFEIDFEVDAKGRNTAVKTTADGDPRLKRPPLPVPALIEHVSSFQYTYRWVSCVTPDLALSKAGLVMMIVHYTFKVVEWEGGCFHTSQDHKDLTQPEEDISEWGEHPDGKVIKKEVESRPGEGGSGFVVAKLEHNPEEDMAVHGIESTFEPGRACKTICFVALQMSKHVCDLNLEGCAGEFYKVVRKTCGEVENKCHVVAGDFGGGMPNADMITGSTGYFPWLVGGRVSAFRPTCCFENTFTMAPADHVAVSPGSNIHGYVRTTFQIPASDDADCNIPIPGPKSSVNYGQLAMNSMGVRYWCKHQANPPYVTSDKWPCKIIDKFEKDAHVRLYPDVGELFAELHCQSYGTERMDQEDDKRIPVPVEGGGCSSLVGRGEDPYDVQRGINHRYVPEKKNEYEDELYNEKKEGRCSNRRQQDPKKCIEVEHSPVCGASTPCQPLITNYMHIPTEYTVCMGGGDMSCDPDVDILRTDDPHQPRVKALTRKWPRTKLANAKEAIGGRVTFDSQRNAERTLENLYLSWGKWGEKKIESLKSG